MLLSNPKTKGPPKDAAPHATDAYLLSLLQVEQSNVSGLFIAGDDFLVPVRCALIGRGRPSVLIG